ncbi:MAG: copper transporter [Acidimicrobiia bacterium]
MINFRFHIASLIAVFLALALGVVMGSTVIDRAIVAGLRDRINHVEDNADKVRADNDRLRSQLRNLNDYANQSASYTVESQLTDQPVAIVAERGVDEDKVNTQAALLRQAGAVVPGVLWLESGWNLGDAKSADAMRAALGSTTRGDKALRDEAIAALARRLTQGAAVPGQPDVLDALAKAGFVTLEGIGKADVSAADFPGSGARALLIGGPQSAITAENATRDLTRALVGAKALTAVGELDPDNATNRGAWLASVRNDDQLKAVVSTIDDVDLVQGRVAAALALAGLGRGVVGSYGYGAGAQQSVPAIPTAG